MGMNKTTNLSKELQFFEKVRYQALRSACLVQSYSAAYDEA